MKENMNGEPLELRAKSFLTEVDGTEGRIMFAPAGDHTITCGAGPRSQATAMVTIRITPETAAVLNASLAEINARNSPQKACFDKDHEGKEATAWPVGFEYSERPKPGVYSRAELSALGKELIEGKVLRAFSGAFTTDADLPRQSACRPGTVYTIRDGKRGSVANPAEIVGLTFPFCGTLTNNPAFRKNLPLWARSSAQERTPEKKEAAPETKPTMKNKTEDRAELQATIKTLEGEIAELKAREQDAPTAETLEEKEAELTAAANQLQVLELTAKTRELEAEVLKRREQDAEAAVKDAVKRGVFPAKDEKAHLSAKKRCVEDPNYIAELTAMSGSVALSRPGRLTPSYPRLEMKREDSGMVLQAFAKERDAVKRGIMYKNEIIKRLAEGDPMPLSAAGLVNRMSDVDPMQLSAATITAGTLAGTLVSQRTLELLKFTFPAITSISTDFSAEYAKLNQAIDSRIVTVPSVVDYDAVNGWVDQDVTFTDAPVTMNKQRGVPITFTSDLLSSTVRRLFDEIGPAQSYAMAKDMMDALYVVITAANFTNAPTVSNLINFGRPPLVSAGVALTKRGVMKGSTNRFALLNSDYFGQLSEDASLVSLSSFQRPAIIEEGVLQDVAGFRVIDAPNLPATGNLAGFCGSRSSLLIAARLDSDYVNVIPGASYGNVTIVTDPDLGLSVTQTQYVDHQKAKTTQRITLIYGVAKGQINAGQRITSA